MGRGSEPSGRGDPLAVTGAVDQLVGSVQKAACLQMMYDRRLESRQGSPMMVPVDPEGMTPLIPGLPDSLKPTGIQLQGKIQNTPHIRQSYVRGNCSTAANEETGRSLMQANVNLLYRSTSFYTLSEAARFKQIGS